MFFITTLGSKIRVSKNLCSKLLGNPEDFDQFKGFWRTFRKFSEGEGRGLSEVPTTRNRSKIPLKNQYIVTQLKEERFSGLAAGPILILKRKKRNLYDQLTNKKQKICEFKVERKSGHVVCRCVYKLFIKHVYKSC